MTCTRSCRQSVSSRSNSITTNRVKPAAVGIAVLLAAIFCFAQDQPRDNQSDAQTQQAKAETPGTVTIPAGTRLALVLTHPIQSRYIGRGDEIYAQVSSPVDSGNEVVIPVGTFVQGTVDKLGHSGGRGELHLQSMSITFPDGYVAPISGPITLQTDNGYAIKDPGSRRGVAAFALPAAGVGLGALIGHSVGSSSSTTTSAFPPGCTGPPPFCSSVSTPVSGTKGRDTIIGAGVGGAIGMFASLGLLFSSHHFYIDAGAPVEMTLQQPVTLQQNEVADAVRRSVEHPAYQQPVAPRPVPPPVDTSPSTPPIIIPEASGGPPIIIPPSGTP